MLERLFPPTANNDYRGHWLALWVFVPITVVTLVRSGIHIFRADGGAQSIATIPLDTYSDPAATAVILVFALWGLSQLLLGLPIGLLYHIGFCLAAALMMALLVNYAWPRHLRDEEERESHP